MTLALRFSPSLHRQAALLLAGEVSTGSTGLDRLHSLWGYPRMRCPGFDRGPQFWHQTVLLRFDCIPSQGCPLPALLVIHRGFLLAKHRQILSFFAPSFAQTVFDRESLVTGSARSLQRLVNGGALSLKSFSVGRMILLHERQRCRWRAPFGALGRVFSHQRQNQQGGCAAAHKRPHVSPVSTTRRSSARNSLDCISLSRETVRGNSCASGPSV